LAEFNSLSLYLHIPFCVKRCSYCDFYSTTGFNNEIITRTLDGILMSLKSSLSLLRPRKISTIYIGGGTPSLIPPKALGAFLEALNSMVGVVEEFTIEVNPESLSRDILEAVSGSHVNRISLGVQTYSDELLTWLGRPAGASAVDRAETLLDRLWKRRLSRDLLAAIPYREDRLSRDIDRASADSPGHISIYELTVEERSPLAGNPKRVKELPDKEVAALEWESALQRLDEIGYARYEVSNFAIPGEESRHNLSYWRMQPYLGVGPGAFSTIPSGKGSAVRRIETSNLQTWLSSPKDSYTEFELGVRDFALEHFLMGMRVSEGISGEHFGRVFGLDPAKLAPRALSRRIASKDVVSEGGRIRPSAQGMDFVDSILVDFALEMDAFHWSRSYDWPS